MEPLHSCQIYEYASGTTCIGPSVNAYLGAHLLNQGNLFYTDINIIEW